jgi:hypothetical protein
MDTYQRAVIRETLERIAESKEILTQQEQELRMLLEKDADDTNKQ